MRTKRCVIRTAVLGLLCGLVLSGCDVLENVVEEAGDLLRITSSAEAQDEDDQLIETFVIDVTTFELEADVVPTVDVSDNATVYTLASDGEVRFTKSDGGSEILDLDDGDKVIERPASGHVTVIRDE